jgi:hypothetical protein
MEVLAISKKNSIVTIFRKSIVDLMLLVTSGHSEEGPLGFLTED